MCLSPIYVANPAYRATSDTIVFDIHGRDKKKRYIPASAPLSTLRDKESYRYIKCGCGHCPECASLKQSYLSQRCELMSLTHYVFFQTLTLKNKYLKYVCVNGVYNKYFDIHYFQNYTKMLKKYDVLKCDGKFKYLACTEYGGFKHRPHMHILYFVPKSAPYWQKFQLLPPLQRIPALLHEARDLFFPLLRYWRVNTSGSTKHPVWDTLLDYRVDRRTGRKNYDFQYVTSRNGQNGIGNVTRYVTKYMLKYDKWIESKQQAFRLNLSVDDYRDCWTNKVRPKCLISKEFGWSKSGCESFENYVKKCLDYTFAHKVADTREEYYYISMVDGRVSTLSPYLRKRYVSDYQSVAMWMSSKQVESSYDFRNEEFNKRLQRGKRSLVLVKSKCSNEFIEFDCMDEILADLGEDRVSFYNCST